MKNLRFQGASGWIEFNQYRSVSTPIDVLWILDNETDIKHVGLYNPLQPSDFYITLNASDLPSDTVPQVNEYILIPLPVAIVLYIVTGCVIFLTTIQLFLYLAYRHHKVDQGYQSLPQLAHVCWMLPLLCCCYSTHYIWEFCPST